MDLFDDLSIQLTAWRTKTVAVLDPIACCTPVRTDVLDEDQAESLAQSFAALVRSDPAPAAELHRRGRCRRGVRVRPRRTVRSLAADGQPPHEDPRRRRSRRLARSAACGSGTGSSRDGSTRSAPFSPDRSPSGSNLRAEAVLGVVDRVDGAVGSGPGDGAVGRHGEGPAAFVGEVVMLRADRDEV